MASVDVVLCFSHQETAYGNNLAEALFKRGVKVFNFVQDIPAGSPWLATIEDNIKSCSVFIPILTNASAKSKWVNREIELAKKLGKAIVPLLLEGEGWRSLESIQYLDVRDGSIPQASFFDRINQIIENTNKQDYDFDVYVSYNTKDRPDSVRKFVTTLESKKFNVWFGEVKLQDAKNWREIAREALGNSRLLLVIIGPKGIGRGQKEELVIAQSFSSLICIPVLLPGTSLEDLPDFLTYQDWIDFRTGLDDKGNIRRLNKTIKQHIPIIYTQFDDFDIAYESAPPSKLYNFLDNETQKKIALENRHYELEERNTVSETRKVLNANFAYSPHGALLKPRDGVVEGEKCCLLVDIGKPWKKGISITQGKIEIGDILSSNDDYVVQVVFISDDFEPKMVSTEIFVQANGESSFPITNGERGREPGPAVLWMKAPQFPNGFDSDFFMVHGRLCLYYGNYLLQSAVVSVGVVKERWVRLRKNNKIKVDYKFSGNFEGIRSQLENRRINFDNIGEISKPVTLNLTMNDDGYGHHRILAKYSINSNNETNLPPARKNYDPETGKIFLAEFRNELKDCYKEFDPSKYQNKRKKFIADLTALAQVGSKLRAAIFDSDDLLVPDNQTQEEWTDELNQALYRGTVIQVSRTGSSNYIFPWAMIYEYSLEDEMPERYESCKVLWEEWDKNAIRRVKDNFRTQCPHHKEHEVRVQQSKLERHPVNIICPYGFWGYKHIIEQPLSPETQLSTAPNTVKTGGNFVLSIGVTNDIKERDKHLGNLRKGIPQAQLDPNTPADNRDDVGKMLYAPKIVYFLCHGEKENGQTYISIGEHDKSAIHKITSATLKQWKGNAINLKAWGETNPLIFINGCGTADLRPGLAFDLVSTFANLKAGGVIGTEVSIHINTAYPAAEHILKSMAQGAELGRAVRDMRWELLNHGDLLGLAYTPYGLADLHIT